MSWRIGLSSGSWAASSLTEVLPILTGSGAHGFELGTPPGYSDSWPAAQVEILGRSLVDLSLEVVSIHAPFGGSLDLADPNPDHRRRAVAAMLTAVNAVRRMGGHLVVVHPTDLERYGRNVDTHLADAAHGLAVLAENCRNAGLTLVIETPLPHLIGGHPDEFAWLLKHIDASARVCLDTGHTALGRSWHRFLQVADGRLAHVHASDNRGERDDHLPPGDGTIDWADITRTLQAVDYSGWIMLELHPQRVDTIEYVKRAYQRAAALLPSNAGDTRP
jgi:sugar phosphate isomerase/epimerase